MTIAAGNTRCKVRIVQHRPHGWLVVRMIKQGCLRIVHKSELKPELK